MSGFVRLNRRQRRFITALLTAPTIEAAAQVAGISERTGYRYLDDPEVRAELSRRQDQAVAVAVAALSELGQDAIDALRSSLDLLEEHAGGDLADFLRIDEAGGWYLDLAGAEAAGKLPLVKKLWRDAQGNERLELHDPQAAAVKRARLALDILAERRKVAELDDLNHRVSVLEKRILEGDK